MRTSKYIFKNIPMVINMHLYEICSLYYTIFSTTPPPYHPLYIPPPIIPQSISNLIFTLLSLYRKCYKFARKSFLFVLFESFGFSKI